MATVPVYDQLRQGLSDAPRGRASAPGGPSGAAIAAEQAQSFGAAIQDAGSAGASMVADAMARQREAMQRAQDQADEVRVLDAVNRAKERAFDLEHGEGGFSNAKGFDALNRPDGKDLRTETTERFDAAAREISVELGNPRQRQAFERAAQSIRLGLYQSAQQHQAREFRSYQVSVYDGAVATAQRQIAAAGGDPKAVESATATIRAATAQKARLTGVAQDMAEAQSAEALARGHADAVTAMVERRDYKTAQAYLDRWGKDMDAAHVARTSDTLRKEWEADEAVSIGQRVIRQQAAAEYRNSDAGAIVHAISLTESRGRRYDDNGAITLGPAVDKMGGERAIGEMQVMPSTVRKPGYGIKPGNPDDPEDVARVGRELTFALIKEFGGDPLKAAAAYNWGPANLRKAIDKANAAGADWREFLPGGPRGPQKGRLETYAYVKRFESHLVSVGKEKPRAPDRQAIYDEVHRLTAGMSPAAKAAAIREADVALKQREDAEKKAGDDAEAAAYKALEANGGDWRAIPAGMRSAVRGTDVPQLMAFADRLGKGEATKTDPAVYLRLSDPEVLRGLSEGEMYRMKGALDESDWQHFVKQRAGLLGKGGDGGDLPPGVGQVLKDRLSVLGVDATPEEGSAEALRVGAIRRFVDQQLIAAQAHAGKKFTDAEVRQHIDRLFATSHEVRGWFSTTRAPLLTAKIGDIPEAEKAAIKAAYARQGNESPTDGEILTLWFHAKQR